MTVERARDILQEEIQDFSDEQVVDVISKTGALCDHLLDVALREALTHRKENVYYD